MERVATTKVIPNLYKCRGCQHIDRDNCSEYTGVECIVDTMKQLVFVLVYCLVLSVTLWTVEGEDNFSNNYKLTGEHKKSGTFFNSWWWHLIPITWRESFLMFVIEHRFNVLKGNVTNLIGPEPIQNKEIRSLQASFNDLYTMYGYLVYTLKEENSHRN